MITDANPKTKSAKKNQKRREAAAKKKAAAAPASKGSGGFSIVEDIPTGAVVSRWSPPPPSPTIDPITALKLQIEEAKSAKVVYIPGDKSICPELRRSVLLWGVV